MADSITEHSAQFQKLSEEVSKVIIGQKDTIQFMLLGVLCDGHILLEGVPGVAKTTMALGRAVRRTQTGQLQLYGLFIGVGVLAIILILYIFG